MDKKKNNGQNFWEILERIIGKISSIIGAGLIIEWHSICPVCQPNLQYTVYAVYLAVILIWRFGDFSSANCASDNNYKL